MKNLDEFINSSIQWLISSGIRNKDDRQKNFGAFNNAYNYKEKKYTFVYSEITGYGVSLFCNLYKWHNKKDFLNIGQFPIVCPLKTERPAKIIIPLM